MEDETKIEGAVEEVVEATESDEVLESEAEAEEEAELDGGKPKS